MKAECITVYPQTIEIKYDKHTIKICFDFTKNTFKAFIEKAISATIFDVEEKQEYLSIIDKCLNAIKLQHTKVKFDIKKVEFTSGSCNVITESPECYIKSEDMFDWITVQKIKGVIQ